MAITFAIMAVIIYVQYLHGKNTVSTLKSEIVMMSAELASADNYIALQNAAIENNELYYINLERKLSLNQLELERIIEDKDRELSNFIDNSAKIDANCDNIDIILYDKIGDLEW